jgi:hypothetical protein
MDLTCDRCGRGDILAHVDEALLVDDPCAATGALCPECATDDDPRHIPGSWLLTWD